ncbi:MAG: hypothetical protein V4617_08170 [Gemmatimonadota bacterium]
MEAALRRVPPKPSDEDSRHEKKRYSEQISRALALAIAAELRARGLKEARPGSPGELGGSGAEPRIAGGLGAKKVDISWATPATGLLLAVSIKSINFRDTSTDNFQKNVINRRGDLLLEAVSLHRRFPFAVLCGLLVFDEGATLDATPRRRSTFLNAHEQFRLFDGRTDPEGRDERFEHLCIGTVNATPFHAALSLYRVGRPDTPVPLEQFIDGLVHSVAARNADTHQMVGNRLRRARR